MQTGLFGGGAAIVCVVDMGAEVQQNECVWTRAKWTLAGSNNFEEVMNWA